MNQDYLRTHIDLPNSWQMLAQQRDIRIGMTDFMAADASSNLLYSMVAEYGDQRAFDIWRRIQPKIMQYSKYLHTPVRQAGMGEVDLSVTILSETLRYVHDDYPHPYFLSDRRHVCGDLWNRDRFFASQNRMRIRQRALPIGC